MRLLICTQVMDVADPVLGFFCPWVEELAKQYEKITVICLREGEHDLPENVKVYSLGKENGAVSKLRYSWRFLQLIFNLRNEYDAVFVHMNQEYVLLGGLYWKLFGKRVYLWRNHWSGSIFTDWAVRSCTKVFYTSKHSYTAKFPNAVIMPVGIDTEQFKPNSRVQRDPRSILFLGRMAPSKKPDVLLRALSILREQNVLFKASFYGSPVAGDEVYYENLKHQSETLGLGRQVTFHSGIPNTETPRVYVAHNIFVNCSSSGMYDKTIFEAAASECLVLASSQDFGELAGERFVFPDGNAEALAEKLNRFLALSVSGRQEMGTQLRGVALNHSLAKLGEQLAEEII